MNNMHLKPIKGIGMLSLNLVIEFGYIWGIKIFSTNRKSKLHYKGDGPSQVIEQINSNA